MQFTKKKNYIVFQLAEAMYEYGKGNYHKAFDAFGLDFDATKCKVGLFTVVFYVVPIF